MARAIPGTVAVALLLAIVVGGLLVEPDLGRGAQATPAPTGPIRIVSPTEGEQVLGPNVAIVWEAPGLTIVPAAQATVETDYHAHFIVDRAYEVVEGVPLPTQACVVHTAANPATITLGPGRHRVELVIGNPGHVPVPGLDRPIVSFTVVVEDATPAASPIASPVAGACPAPGTPTAMAGTPAA